MSHAKLKLAARLSEFTDSEGDFPLTLRGWHQTGLMFDGEWRDCPVRSEFTLQISNLAAKKYLLSIDPDVRNVSDPAHPFEFGKQAVCSNGAMDVSVRDDWLVELNPVGALHRRWAWAFPALYRWQNRPFTQEVPLLEALANAGPSAEITETADLVYIHSGAIRTQGYEGFSESETSSKTVMVLDKTRNYLLLYLNEYHYDIQQRKNLGVKSITEVKRAQELTSGHWLPMEVEYTSFKLAKDSVDYRGYLCYESVVEDEAPQIYTLDYSPDAHVSDHRKVKR